MNIKNFSLMVCCFLLSSSLLHSQEVLQFRGENSAGKYPCKNLLQAWPEDGPALLWEAQDIGNGYGSPAITDSGIFVNGEIDSVTYLFAIDYSGKILWKQEIGKEWVSSYPGARSTPTIVDDYVYVSAGMGEVACFDARTGKKIWNRNLIDDFNGVMTRFGFASSIINYKDMVFCAPGGEEKNILALNKKTGDIVWNCRGKGDMTAFSTPLIVKLPERHILITFSMGYLLGIDINNGELLWTHEQEGEGDVHVNTPLFEKPYLYYIAGNGNGAVKLRLSDDGSEIEEVWKNNRSDNLMGGFIKIDDYIYTSGDRRRYWYSINANTGEITDSVRFDKGVTIYADGKLYLYNERGRIALFAVENGSFNKISEFRITLGSKAHFAHPVINKGILYVRRGESLMAYDIRNNSDN